MKTGLVTVLTIAATIGAVFTLPVRRHAVIEQAIVFHQSSDASARPLPSEIAAALAEAGIPARISAPLLHQPVQRLARLGSAAAAASFGESTLVIARSQGLPPRRLELTVSLAGQQLSVVAWRTGPWQLVAIGPRAGEAKWRRQLGVP